MNLTEKFLKFASLGAEWVLWLLVVLSVISVYVMIERILFYRSIAGDDARIRRGLFDALSANDIDGAKAKLKGADGPGARIVREMLQSAGDGARSLRARMEAVLPEERVRLGKNLSFLGTLGVNAPFIGLFGTVLGIIQAFKDLGTAGVQSGETSKVVMAGISEALVATAVGLLVAIPAVVAYNVFQRRVKKALGEAEAMGSTTFALLTAERQEDKA
ncbi:MAG: MotA/TolQ/ExbB proton channel family protein [Nannocystaceae bacterium]|nr:MotA/TolQ/ExbB proton channel family protein [Nannocystaceae bacterium]